MLPLAEQDRPAQAGGLLEEEQGPLPPTCHWVLTKHSSQPAALRGTGSCVGLPSLGWLVTCQQWLKWQPKAIAVRCGKFSSGCEMPPSCTADGAFPTLGWAAGGESWCHLPGEAQGAQGQGEAPPCPDTGCINPIALLPTGRQVLLASDTDRRYARMGACPSCCHSPAQALPPALACITCPASVSPSA